MRVNEGFARACNRAARQASGEILMFMNPDAILVHVNAEMLERELEKAGWGVAVPANRVDGILEHDVFDLPSPRMEYWNQAYGHLWPRSLGRSPWRLRRGREWASGAMLLAPRKGFLDIGGFDESFFLLYEDREFSLRCTSSGRDILALSGLVGAHSAGLSSPNVDLGPRRPAWAALSWIEYLAISEGEASARRWGRAWMSALRRQARLAERLPVCGPSAERLRQKCHACGEIVRLVEGGCEGLFDRGFYRRAVGVLVSETYRGA